MEAKLIILGIFFVGYMIGLSCALRGAAEVSQNEENF